MQVQGLPNKYKIYQDFYFELNGKQISYSEALRLFSQMDESEKSDFEQYYKDETGYEIISANGYNLDPKIELKTDENGELVVKTTKKKGSYVKQSDGTIKYQRTEQNIYDSNASLLKKANIAMKYNIEAIAKKRGIVLDSVWSQFTAEEIVRMNENGTYVPKEVLEIANAAIEANTSLYVNNNDENDENVEDTETKKESYLELIPKAAKKIEKCNKNNEKITEKIDDLLPEKQNAEKNYKDKIENQKQALEKFEKQLREWRSLQNKVNNGEALSDKEAARYAMLTGMLEDRGTNDFDEPVFDKNEIAKSLNEINILAVIGEKLADETIEIGETLADCTSTTNYKSTRNEAAQAIGFLSALKAMVEGKALSKEALNIGQDTKEYVQDTTHSSNEIASIVGIENQVLSTNELKESNFNTDDIDTEPSEEAVKDANENEQEKIQETDKDSKNPEVSKEEDFIINDENVKELIKEAELINSDLAAQMSKALKDAQIAKKDEGFAKIANAKIQKLVKEFQAEQAKRDEETSKLEEENNQSKAKLQELTGKSEKEQDTEINQNSNPQTGKTTENEIEKLKVSIQNNSDRITEIDNETQKAINNFKQNTKKEKTYIETAIPENNDSMTANSTYKEEVIPVDAESLSFTDNSGVTLQKMGEYRINIGIQQIRNFQNRIGIENIRKGKISKAIGINAQDVSDTKTLDATDNATTNAVSNEQKAITGLNEVDGKISSITGEETAQNSYDAKNANGESPTQTSPTPEEEVDVPENNGVTGDKAPAETPENNPENTPAEPKQEDLDTAPTAPSKAPKKEAPKGDKKAADKSQKEVDNINKNAEKDAKDSLKIKKNTEKTSKQLTKEAQKLQKQIIKDQKEAEKLIKESEEAAKKQEELFAQYETISAENEQLEAENGNNQPAQQNGGALLAGSTMSVNGTQGSDNSDKINLNNETINTISGEFKVYGNVINRNRVKITNFQKSTTKISKAFTKKTKAANKKAKQEQKAEKNKQQKLQKQLGAVGIAGNVFSITTSTGMIMNKIGTGMIVTGTGMLSNPITAAEGAALIASGTPIQTTGITLTTVGTYGTISCGVAKSAINIANGNLVAGLVSLGTTAVSAVGAMSGTGAAANNLLGAVSNGLSIVSNGAEMVNNIRAVQGKEASGFFGKISTIAGAGSALTGAAASFTNSKSVTENGIKSFDTTKMVDGKVVNGSISTMTYNIDTVNAFKDAGFLEQAAMIGSTVGSTLTTTSEIMTEFGGENGLSKTLGAIGGTISTLSSIGQLVAKKVDKKDDSNDTKTEEDKKSQNEKTPTEKEADKQEIKKIDAEIQAEEQKIQAENNTNNNVNDNTNSDTNNVNNSDDNNTTDKQVNPSTKPSDKSDKDVTADDKKPSLKESKEAKAAKKEEAENSGLSRAEKKNMTKNGASKEYADLSDDDLAGKLEFARETGNDALADNLATEMTKRGDYKEKMAVISENKAETISKITEGVGQGMQAVSSIMNMGSSSNKQGQQKKKGSVAQTMTKRSKDIIKKHQKRIKALQKSKQNKY